MTHENNLFDSVIHITKERDTHSLEKALLRTIADYVEFDTLSILRKFEDSDLMEISACMPEDAHRDDSGDTACESDEQRVEPDESIRRCINSADIISTVKNGNQRILFPITLNDTVTNVLDIKGRNGVADAEKIIHGFTRIYSNFLNVLYDNEHDTLTGLLNRKTFDLRLSELVAVEPSTEDNADIYAGAERRIQDDASNNWIGVLDIDHFKSINDNYGHLFGDEVLLLFANHMKNTFRSDDLLFRYGGEEFVVVLSSVSEANAISAFERFRRTIESFDFPQVGRVTVSTGIVKMESHDHPTTVLEHADLALYYAKDHGRNQVRNYHQLLNDGEIKNADIVDDFEMF